MATRKRATSDLKIEQGKQRDAYFSRLRRQEAARGQRLAKAKAAVGDRGQTS